MAAATIAVSSPHPHPLIHRLTGRGLNPSLRDPSTTPPAPAPSERSELWQETELSLLGTCKPYVIWISLCRTWRDFGGLWEPSLGLVAKRTSGHRPLAGCWETQTWTWGDMASQSGGLCRCGVHLPIPSHPHAPHSAAPPRRASIGPQTVHPACPPAQPGPASVHQLLLRQESTRPTLGPQGFLLHKEWTATPVWGPEGQDRLGTGSFHPSAWGRSPTGLPQILYTRSILCVCVPCLCACKWASVDYPRNMHFGTRLVTSHTSFSLRPGFHLKR